MKNISKIVFILLVLSSGCVSAQVSTLIKKLQAQYQGVTHYRADFTQEKKTEYISRVLITKGQLELAINHGVIWEVEKPLWVKTLITEDGVFKSTKYRKKHKVRDMQMTVVAEIITDILTANFNKIESHFNLSVIDLDQKNQWQIIMTPKKTMMKKTLKKIIIKSKNTSSHDQSLKGINEIALIDTSDNSTRIILQNIVLSTEPISTEIRARFE